MKLVKKNWLLTAAVSASLAGLAGCNNDNDNDNDIFDKQVKLLVADDQGGNVGSISQYQFSSNSGPGAVEHGWTKRRLLVDLAKVKEGYLKVLSDY